MANRTLPQFPVTEIRESKFELEYILKRISANGTEKMPNMNDPYLELILRLGNEIQKLQKEVKELKELL